MNMLIPVTTDEPTWGLWYWPTMLIVAFILFASAESLAFATYVGNTLTDYSRTQLQEYAQEPVWRHIWGWYLSQAAYLAFSVWIVGHIWYDMWG